MRVLVIEDEEPIRDLLKRGLEEERFVVETAVDGVAGLRLAIENAYSMIVLDLLLPGRDGWSVCEEIRTRGIRTPILILSARDAVRDRVRGLELGADDYLPKPFDFGELLARVRAILRRDHVHKGRILKIEYLEIDTASRRVFLEGQEVILTPREYALLEALAANEGRVMTREVIQSYIWSNEESYSNTVDVHIKVLRKKIDADRDMKLIHTVVGTGFVLKRPERESVR